MGGGRAAITVAPIIFVAVVMAALQVADATTYKVGDDSGWIVPDDSSFYSDWASEHTFYVNDILQFDFGSRQHTVAQVSKTDYEDCGSSSPISSWTSSPASVTLESTGSLYFICTVGSHCADGQKLTVDVSNSSTTSSTSSPPPPPPSSASSLEAAAAAATWAIFGLVYVVGLL